MRQPQDKPSQAKDRIFFRFLDEHGLKSARLAEDLPEYESSFEEQAGLFAKLGWFDNELGIRETAEDIEYSINQLIKLGYEMQDQRHRLQSCIETQIALLRLFDWLYAFGPGKNHYRVTGE